MVQINLGAAYSYGLLSPYILSYLSQYNPNIKIDDGFFFYPLTVISMCASLAVGAYMEKKFGPRPPILICWTIVGLSYLGLYFAKSLLVVYLLLLFMGVGNGLGVSKI